MSKQRNIGYFTQCLDKFLADITTIEINTIVVDQISENRFISWEAYRDIYLISQEYLKQIGIHNSLQERYLSLRRDLEMEYLLIARDSQSDFYEPQVTNSHLLRDSTVETPSFLPSPLNQSDSETILKLEKLLKYPQFLLSLRRISEFKNVLDKRNNKLIENPNYQEKFLPDFVYAQTIIQLDGHITNRYSQQLINHPDKETLLQFHQSGVEGGTKTWRELLVFIVQLIRGDS